MDRLWSPWRSQHVAEFDSRQRPPGAGSIFSRLAADAERDDDHLVLWRGERVFVVMNLYPYNNGHLLIVPYREVQRYTELTPEEQDEIARTIDRAMRWLEAALKPDGYNVGMNVLEAGGAGIPEHLHVHVVPRWRGDTNFMPVTADVKLVPEAMRETFGKLLQAVRAVEPPAGQPA
jgi:ATP adenylyltransferase